MSEKEDDLQRLSPDGLMTMFSRSHIALCLVIAIGLHVAVIASTSMPYIRDRWIDPEGARLRQIARQRELDKRRAAQRAARRWAATRASATRPATTRKAGPKAARDAQQTVPAGARQSRMYKATTRKASPEEIPKLPEELKVPLE